MNTLTHQPSRVSFGWLLLTGAVVILPHLANLPLWLIALVIGFAGWRYYHLYHGGYIAGRLLRIVLTLLVVVLVYKHYHAILGRDSGIALLTALIGLKFLELRRMRDYMLSLFLYYFLIFGAFLYTQSLWMGVYLFVAIAACTATQIRLLQISRIRLSDNLRLTARLLLHALPMMLVLYLLFPRIEGTLWGLPKDAFSSLTGMSDVMEPGSISNLSNSPKIAFRVEFEGTPPKHEKLYWRGLVLWHTDGRRWLRGQPAAPGKQAFPKFQRQATGVQYTVTLEPSNQPWMLALDLPFTVPAGTTVQPGFLLQKSFPIRKRLRYTLVSFPSYNTGSLNTKERFRALQLPDNIDKRVRALANHWRQQARQPQDIVQAALSHIRQEKFSYTLQPPLLGDDPVAEFLFDTRRGFCGHYASAFVTLMRLAGIPSRVVTGYLGGEFNATGNYLIVRQADAHAWAEVWLPGTGWRRVDPTSAVAPERVEYGIDAIRRLESQGLLLGSLSAEVVLRAIQLGWFERTQFQTRQYWDAANLSWYRWVLNYDHQRQNRLLATFGMGASSWLLLLVILSVAVVIILIAMAVVLRWRRPRVDRVQALYLRFCRKLARVGLVRAPNEGALAFAQRSMEQRPDLQAGIEAVTRLYLRLRYGKPPKGSELVRDLKYLVGEFKSN